MFLSLFATLLLAPAQESADEQIRAHRQVFVSAVLEQNVDGALSLLASDAVMLVDKAPLIEGKEAIRRLAKTALEAAPTVFRMETLRIECEGGLAYEIGRYVRTSRAVDGKETIERGKYLDVWRRGPDGQWQIVVHAPSSDPEEVGR